jgi:hypothetical protein
MGVLLQGITALAGGSSVSTNSAERVSVAAAAHRRAI